MFNMNNLNTNIVFFVFFFGPASVVSIVCVSTFFQIFQRLCNNFLILQHFSAIFCCFALFPALVSVLASVLCCLFCGNISKTTRKDRVNYVKILYQIKICVLGFFCCCFWFIVKFLFFAKRQSLVVLDFYHFIVF